VLESLDVLENSGGVAADTGSLVHTGVLAYHKTKSLDKALKAMKLAVPEFPRGDLKEAALHLTPYTEDPRNQGTLVIAEETIEFCIPEDIGDTGGPIYVRGHLDQVREENGKLYVWDVKTGKRYQGWEMLQIATIQLAAYTIGASQLLNRPVYPGGIIRTYGYRVRGAALPEPSGVFFHAAWDLKDCATLLAPVAKRVKEIRERDYYVIPGDYCGGCSAGGVESCLPMIAGAR
jgi:hypothetical protein